jgi:hypothetical protein
MGSGAKSYMRKGFLIYEKMRKFSPYTRRPLVIYYFAHFLTYEVNFIIFFICRNNYVTPQSRQSAQLFLPSSELVLPHPHSRRHIQYTVVLCLYKYFVRNTNAFVRLRRARCATFTAAAILAPITSPSARP